MQIRSNCAMLLASSSSNTGRSSATTLSRGACPSPGSLSVGAGPSWTRCSEGAANTMMPLEGYRLLDLSRLQPGPSGSHVLADLGMDVIKIEEMEPRGGMGRDVLTPVIPTPETEVEYAAYNAYARNKKSIAINLQTPEGKEVLYRLVRSADAFWEGYRPGVMARLGCDYETLSKINPRLVYVSLSGYGQDGPYAKMPGHDPNYCSVAGQLSIQGDEFGTPVGNGVPLADVAGGIHAAMGTMAAIMAREKTGRGQYIDITLTHSVMSFMVNTASNYFRAGIKKELGGETMGVVKCQDGKFLTLANAETHFWANFCKAIERPEFIALHRWTDANADQFDMMVKDVKATMMTKPRDVWFKILSDADTCVAPILEIDEVFEDPQNLHRGMLLEVDHPTMGKIKQIGPAIKFSDTPFSFRNFAPVLGEQTEELLREVGYSQQEIAALEQAGAVKAWKEQMLAGR
ncbi:MAG: CaiB/BaiF CoA-transferase family protein [Chloroflexi bacterium]|nr:CaiB/BaiF CoA-transferase family protein [Chloroflexota bacterium]